MRAAASRDGAITRRESPPDMTTGSDSGLLRRWLPWLALTGACGLLLGAGVVLGQRLATSDAQTDAQTDAGTRAKPRRADRGGDAQPNPRMANAVSPYLQMHADNPVAWYRWGETALRKARAEDKPIFLSIGYYTCYWCHVMERESFADPEVAAVLNEHFVPIKVDREAQPGVDSLYMRALRVMGQRGGWPLSMFLTPERVPFFGATYLPKAQFMRGLEEIHDIWVDERERIESVSARVLDGLERSDRIVGVGAAGKVPSTEALDAALREIRRDFDEAHGGFSSAPKFPQASKLALLLDRAERADDDEARRMVTTTLDAMAAGGIHDQVGGGFHRYSTDARWHVPHFEKMLYTNAQLLRVYARAARLTDDARYGEVAAGIAAYVERTLTDPDSGLFYSAQSSLVNGVEGKSHTWTREEVAHALDDERLTRIAVALYGLDGEPDVEHGEHVLHRPRTPDEVAASLDGVGAEDVLAARETIDKRLLAARAERVQASVGTKHVLGWNAQMIEALAYAGRVLDRPEWIARAERAAEAVDARLIDASGGPLHAIRGERGDVPAQAFDYATLMLAQLELARATEEAQWRTRAVATAKSMVTKLWNAERGVFDRRPDRGALVMQTTDLQDGAVPGGNSVAARAFATLAHAEGPHLAPYAATVLRAYRRPLDRRPSTLAYMLTALAAYHDGKLPLRAEVPDAWPQATAAAVPPPAQGWPRTRSARDREIAPLDTATVVAGELAHGP